MRQITNVSKQAVRPQIVTTAFPCDSLIEYHTYQGSRRNDFPSECFATRRLRSFEDRICLPDERLRG
jgi:hypothetical protein